MTMRIPEEIRDDIRAKLWAEADELGWSTISDVDRSSHYEKWTRSAEIGARLGHFMDPRKVRVYIKDSLLKPYERKRLSLTEGDVWRALSMDPRTSSVIGNFIKPHGMLLDDGRVICWGKSRDWKLILFASFERGKRNRGARPFAVILFESGKTVAPAERELVRDAAHRLGIERIEWMEA
ncbi:hypothetical protein GmRootV213_05740 [Variovorax sp. V213]|uniref:hypothetical protein n=1 Tax=Variovorax sp. V213 TaxID=3065955 RepID=UPI0034E8E730